jgi:hypothetical protein
MTTAPQPDRTADRQREADCHELGARAAIGFANEAATPAQAIRDRCRLARMRAETLREARVTPPVVPMARCVHRGCEQTASGLRTDGRCHYHGARADGHGCEPFHGLSGTRGRPRAQPTLGLARHGQRAS